MKTLDKTICLDITREEFKQDLKTVQEKIDAMIDSNKYISWKDILTSLTDYELWVVITKLTWSYRPFKDSKENAEYHLKDRSRAIELFSTEDKEEFSGLIPIK